MELRAVYAVLPRYFQLDSTPGSRHSRITHSSWLFHGPGSENAKKEWREGFVKTLKDLITRDQGEGWLTLSSALTMIW